MRITAGESRRRMWRDGGGERERERWRRERWRSLETWVFKFYWEPSDQSWALLFELISCLSLPVCVGGCKHLMFTGGHTGADLRSAPTPARLWTRLLMEPQRGAEHMLSLTCREGRGFPDLVQFFVGTIRFHLGSTIRPQEPVRCCWK